MFGRKTLIPICILNNKQITNWESLYTTKNFEVVGES